MSACIFCGIANRSIPSEVVDEDDQAVAFEDVNPQAPVHLLVIPKRHIESVQAFETEDLALLGHLLRVCVKMAKEKGLVQSGYRLVTNTGAHGGQTVLHLHLHVLGGRPMRWPPG
jgi:histidine triad (HIT) family protein